MLLFVLRAMQDCSNAGPSAGHEMIEVTLPGKTPDTDSSLPRFWVTRFMGTRIVLPGDPIPGLEDKDLDTLGGWMFSGNYATTSDSRFSQFSAHPLPIFDRREDDRYLDNADPAIRRDPNAERFNYRAYQQMAALLNQTMALLVRRGGGPLTAHLSNTAVELLRQVNVQPAFQPMERDVAPVPSLAQALQVEIDILARQVAQHSGTPEGHRLQRLYNDAVETLVHVMDNAGKQPCKDIDPLRWNRLVAVLTRTHATPPEPRVWPYEAACLAEDNIAKSKTMRNHHD